MPPSPFDLSLEQQLEVEQFRRSVEKMTEDQVKTKLVEMAILFLQKENAFRFAIKDIDRLKASRANFERRVE